MADLYHLQCGSKEKVDGGATQMKQRCFVFFFVKSVLLFKEVTHLVIIAKTGNVHMQQNKPVSGIMEYAVLGVELQ